MDIEVDQNVDFRYFIFCVCLVFNYSIMCVHTLVTLGFVLFSQYNFTFINVYQSTKYDILTTLSLFFRFYSLSVNKYVLVYILHF